MDQDATPIDLVASHEGIYYSCQIAALLQLLGRHWPHRRYIVYSSDPDLFTAAPWDVDARSFDEAPREVQSSWPGPFVGTAWLAWRRWRMTHDPVSPTPWPFPGVHWAQLACEHFGVPVPPREEIVPVVWPDNPSALPEQDVLAYLIKARLRYFVVEPFGGLATVESSNTAWPIERWARLVFAMQRAGIVVVHVARQKEVVLPVDLRVEGLDGTNACRLVYSPHCVGTVGHHGGMTTLARAMQRPVVTLMSAAFDPALWAWPYQELLYRVPPHAGCGGCGCAMLCWHSRRGITECMQAITMADVLEKIRATCGVALEVAG